MSNTRHDECIEECPNIKARVLRAYSDPGVEIWRAIGRTQTSKNHCACTEGRCTANDVSQISQTPLHSKPNCSCASHGLEAEQLISLIEQGDLPLVRLDGDRITLKPWTPGCRFLAISHALSDGLSNQHGNTLPTCQLRRLREFTQDTLRRLGSSESGPKLLWIDVLCIPAREVRSRGASETAVQAMQAVASLASGVIVVDSDVLRLSKTCSYQEAASSILYSSWNSRLWTLYEAVRARRLLFQCSDGVLDMDDIEDKRRLAESTPASMLPSLPFKPLQQALSSEDASVVTTWSLLCPTLQGRRTNYLRDAYVIFRLLFGSQPRMSDLNFIDAKSNQMDDEQMTDLYWQVGSNLTFQRHNGINSALC